MSNDYLFSRLPWPTERKNARTAALGEIITKNAKPWLRTQQCRPTSGNADGEQIRRRHVHGKVVFPGVFPMGQRPKLKNKA